MVKKNMLVTVGIPTYNNPEGLRNTLRCITGQDYKNLEIIVSDNHSSPETQAVVLEFNDPRIRYIRQGKNMGTTYNFEFVLKQATGDFFMWAADDDGWEADYISTLLPLLNMYPNALVAFTNYVKEGKLLGTEELTKELRELGLREILQMVFSLQKINVAAYGLFRRQEAQDLLKNGFARCDAPDRVMFAHFALSGKTVVLTNECLHRRMIHRGSFATRHGGAQYSKAKVVLRGILSRPRYYAEYLKVLCQDARGNKISDLLYYGRLFAAYVVIIELIFLKRLVKRCLA